MAGEILTESEFFAGEAPVQESAPAGKKIVTVESFMGDEVEKPTAVIPAVPEQHKNEFIKTIGDSIYGVMVDSALTIGGSAQGGISNINNFIGVITGLNSFQKYRETFVAPGQEAAQQADLAVPKENLFSKAYYDTLSALGGMAPTIPFDVLTGGTTKLLLAGRIIPKMESMLARLPNFTIGMGWRGMVEGIEGSSNPGEAVVKGIVGAAESTGIGLLFANAGVGLKGIGKMAALGLGEKVYNATKEGRPPTSDEMLEGITGGAMLGLVFTAVPHLIEGTQIAAEKVALKEHQTKFESTKDMSKVLEITDNLLKDERIRPEIRESLAQPFVDMLNKRGKLVVPELKAGTWKDASSLSLLRETTERNLEGVAKAEAPKVKEFTTERIKENETMSAKWQTDYRQLIEQKIKEWGIKPNSLADKLIQRFGEKRMTLEELKAESPKNWGNVVTAAGWFKEQYGDLLKTVNGIRDRYGYEPIPEREDYFRHFQELSTVSEVFGLDLGGTNPPTSIAGIVRKPKPGKPFTPVELKRLGGKFTESAIGGFDNYLSSVAKQIFHTDSVQRMRMLDNYIRGQAETNENIDLSNFMTNIRDYTDILAGQPADIDRTIQRTVGRTAYGLMRWLDKRTAANMIGANISAAVSNNIAFVTSIPTTAKVPALKGLFTSVMTPFVKPGFKVDGVSSELYTRRYLDQKINLTFTDNAAEVAANVFQVADQFAVKAIIAGKYYEGRSKGLDAKTAMREADNYTSGLVTDRSTGQLPVLMESKSLRVFTRFQTEVNNMVSFLQKDVPEQYHGDIKKLVGVYAQFAVYSWIFNNLFEEVAGRRPTIDPIYMASTLLGINKSGRGKELTERIQTASKDFVGSLPFGNMFLEGGRLPVQASLPNPSKMFDDPLGEFSKPLFYLGLPFGGGQIKKTLGGMVDFAKGYSATPKGEERYGIHQDVRNFMQGFVFGKNAFPEAVRYWSLPENER